jgi:hypothetical protein
MDEKATNFHRKRVAFFYDIALIYSDVVIEIPIIGKIGDVFFVIQSISCINDTSQTLDNCEQLGFEANE